MRLRLCQAPDVDARGRFRLLPRVPQLASVYKSWASAWKLSSFIAMQVLSQGLALAGQVVQAAQVIAEEWLLKELKG